MKHELYQRTREYDWLEKSLSLINSLPLSSHGFSMNMISSNTGWYKIIVSFYTTQLSMFWKIMFWNWTYRSWTHPPGMFQLKNQKVRSNISELFNHWQTSNQVGKFYLKLLEVAYKFLKLLTLDGILKF